MAERFMKLYNKMLRWEWYSDTNTFRLFMHCLLKANWERTKWRNAVIEPGQFITSLKTLANETNLTVRQVRVALEHLQMTGELTSKMTNKYRVITVVKWGSYQGEMTSKMTTETATDIEQVEEVDIYNIIKDSLSGNEPDPVPPVKKSNDVELIIDYLNSVLGTHYKATTKANASKIKARLAEGHTVDDFKTVIDKKAKQWRNDPEMSPYLRPETLFAASHFESYLNEIEKTGPKKDKPKFGDYPQRDIDYAELERLVTNTQ